MAKKQNALGFQDGKKKGPVECLGMKFDNDEARREHFLSILREKLKDPQFRKIEGFPIGEDEDILALSDPPYYTACPNPFVGDFIESYGKPYDPETDDYHREPFAADVSEGKNDPIYLAHSYHTKVPHRAIMRYILHYTDPGDIVFDGFCGTGMAGVAALMCGQADIVRSLSEMVPTSGQSASSSKVSGVGSRYPILVDLSPAATYIAAVNNVSFDRDTVQKQALRILDSAEEELGWVYDLPVDHRTGEVLYAIWSEVVICPECSGEFPYWAAAMEADSTTIGAAVRCPLCQAELTKRALPRKVVQASDPVLHTVAKQISHELMQMCVAVGGKKLLLSSTAAALETLSRVSRELQSAAVPTTPMMFRQGRWGDQWRDGYHTGVTHSHHFLLPRPMLIYSRLHESMQASDNYRWLMWFITATLEGASKLNRERPNGLPSKLTGTLYIGSSIREINVFDFMARKISKYPSIPSHSNRVAVSTRSTTSVGLPEKSVDYIFVDPPFGDNLAYSELNFVWESWLKVYTAQDKEAIVSRFQNKQNDDYMRLMQMCFSECYRILKPGRWITVEFHNSRNSVWNAIQEAVTRAGFVIADVRTIDKQQGSFNQVVAASAVKQDLVISAYKPNGGLEARFELEAGTEEGVWDFVRTHLRQLPVFVEKDNQSEVIAERQDYLLFDRMVAFHVQRGVTVPISAAEFYGGLRQRFPERDGMFFTAEQATEYDRKRMTVKEVMQLQLFVTDESSGIQWLRQQLTRKPQTYQDLNPEFMQEIKAWLKHERTLELSELLRENFLCYEGHGEVPTPIHAYLSSNYHELRNLPNDHPDLMAKARNRWYVPDPNREGDLEKIRLRALMKEFEEYQATKGKLKVVRTEALRAGFKQCWQDANYTAIVDLAKRLPSAIVEEDPALLMYYDNALLRTEG